MCGSVSFGNAMSASLAITPLYLTAAGGSPPRIRLVPQPGADRESLSQPRRARDDVEAAGDRDPRRVAAACDRLTAICVMANQRLRLVGMLRDLGPELKLIAPAGHFGFVVPDSDRTSSLHIQSDWGSAGYVFGIGDLPSPLREAPREAGQFASPWADTFATESVNAMWRTIGIERFVVAPLPGVGGLFWTGCRTGDLLTGEQVEACAVLGRRAAALAAAPEDTHESLGRLRRLDLLDELLPALAGALDVRDVFERVAAIAEQVLPHETLVLLTPTDDPSRGQFYARAGRGAVPLPQTVDIPPQMRPTASWDYFVIADLRRHPDESRMTAAQAGFRSSLQVPIRVGQRFLGGLNMMALEPDRYRISDVAIAARVAMHVGLALSHHQLAQDARHAAELHARTASLELLDALLAPLTDTGDVRDVFDQISEIAQKVIRHDALLLPVLVPERKQGRLYATSGGADRPFPEFVDPPAYLLSDPDWEYDIVDDLKDDPMKSHAAAAQLGYRSALRVPIRLDGRFAAALVFVSCQTAVYKAGDVLLARRMADRITLSLSRERRAAALARADEATARAVRLESRVRELTDELDARTGNRRVIGESAEWHGALTQATQVASTDTTVLLLGESGTGKEVIARFLHRASPRRDGPFVAINCAALPEHLLEAELFGYERGAFTGATQSKPGQLEQAAGGTLFLDEVAEMNPASQAKFLRVLQEREFQRLGGTRVLTSNARVIAATNRDLLKAISRGLFREDLYYRLNVFAIHLPALRERPDDILPLSEAFIAEIGRGFGRPVAGISREARRVLMEHRWPGNVRELRNALERAAILCDGGLIAAEHLALRPPAAPPAADRVAPVVPNPPPRSDLKSVERAMVVKALHDAHANKSRAAKLLGLTRAQLYVRLRRYGLR
ncbi:MAG: GAF domain-containing protein [Luteitalea sp.]|nr:GAF domain-containing protein [Luteitalea sp.]